MPRIYMIVPHPSLQRLQLPTNAASIWSALTAGERPPPPQRLDEPQELLIWRQGSNVRFRLLGGEEALAIDAMARDGKFEIAQSTEGFLRGWLEAGIISALRPETGGSR